MINVDGREEECRNIFLIAWGHIELCSNGLKLKFQQICTMNFLSIRKPQKPFNSLSYCFAEMNLTIIGIINFLTLNSGRSHSSGRLRTSTEHAQYENDAVEFLFAFQRDLVECERFLSH